MTVDIDDVIERTTIYEISTDREILTYESHVNSAVLHDILSRFADEGIVAHSISLAPMPKKDLFSISAVMKKTERIGDVLNDIANMSGGSLRDDRSMFRIAGLGARGPDGAIKRIFSELGKTNINIEMYFAGEVEFEFYVLAKDFDTTYGLMLKIIGVMDGIDLIS
ncbi:MAG: ACT domain-containing protein [Thermoleophilia bacterium]